MRVAFLDLKTGRTTISDGIAEQSLTEGNWSCDCNRAIAFDEYAYSPSCIGCVRYIAIAVQAEADETLDTIEVLREANREYFLKLASTKGTT